MSTPESKVKDRIKKRLMSHGLVPVTKAADAPGNMDGYIVGFFFMPVAGPYSVHGIHDFIGCWRSVFFTIEAKAEDNPVDGTPAQLDFQRATIRSGGVSVVGARDESAVELVRQAVLDILKVTCRT